MAWVDALDWQKRALRAERRVQDISGRLAELEAQVCARMLARKLAYLRPSTS
jgi:hypothetical protein